MAQIDGKRMFPVYIHESIYREIKVYAAETDKTFQQVIQEPMNQFEQLLITLVSQIKEMKRKAEQERLTQEENQRLADQYPLIVPGHEVDLISNEQPIPA